VSPFKEATLLVPATAGKMAEDHEKRSGPFTQAKTEPFAFAGVYDVWRADGKSGITSFAIVTTAAAPSVAQYQTACRSCSRTRSRRRMRQHARARSGCAEHDRRVGSRRCRGRSCCASFVELRVSSTAACVVLLGDARASAVVTMAKLVMPDFAVGPPDVIDASESEWLGLRLEVKGPFVFFVDLLPFVPAVAGTGSVASKGLTIGWRRTDGLGARLIVLKGRLPSYSGFSQNGTSPSCHHQLAGRFRPAG